MGLSSNDYRVIVSGRHLGSGDYWEMGFGFLAESSLPNMNAFEAANALIDEFWEQIDTPLLAILASNVIVDQVRAKRVGGVGGPMAGELIASEGQQASICETVGNGAQICWLGSGNDLNQGRTYIPGIPNDSLDDGSWDAAYRTAVVTFITDMQVPLTVDGVDFRFCIQSSKALVDSQIVTFGILRGVPGTQRRRLRR